MDKVLNLNDEQADSLADDFYKVNALLQLMSHACDSPSDIPRDAMTRVIWIAQDSMKNLGKLIEPVFP